MWMITRSFLLALVLVCWSLPSLANDPVMGVTPGLDKAGDGEMRINPDLNPTDEGFWIHNQPGIQTTILCDRPQIRHEYRIEELKVLKTNRFRIKIRMENVELTTDIKLLGIKPLPWVDFPDNMTAKNYVDSFIDASGNLFFQHVGYTRTGNLVGIIVGKDNNTNLNIFLLKTGTVRYGCQKLNP